MQNPPEDNQETQHTTHEWSEHLELLEGLAQLVHGEKLSELEIEQNGVRMTLRSISAMQPALPPTSLPAGVVPDAYYTEWHGDFEEEAAETVSTAASSARAGLVPVVAPMVGLFYRAQSPDDPPFVEEGDHVESGQIIGLVEAMKTFNEIMSDVSGTVREIVANNGALVETGAPLILVEK